MVSSAREKKKKLCVWIALMPRVLPSLDQGVRRACGHKKYLLFRAERSVFHCCTIREPHDSDRKWTVLWGFWGTRPDTSEDPEGMWRVAHSPWGSSAGGLVAPSQFGKGCKPSEILRQHTMELLLPGFQLLKANVEWGTQKTSSLALRKRSVPQ